MHGMPLSLVAAIGIPMAGQCLTFAAPLITAVLIWWVFNHTDQIIERLFPHWEWEKRMGWLNIRARHRAETVLRWMRYGFDALLAAALYGIIWGAESLQWLGQWDDPMIMGELTLRLPVLLSCLALWLLYLGIDLMPQLKRQYEEDELKKYREALQDKGEERRPKRVDYRTQQRQTLANKKAPSKSTGPRRL